MKLLGAALRGGGYKYSFIWNANGESLQSDSNTRTSCSYLMRLSGRLLGAMSMMEGSSFSPF